MFSDADRAVMKENYRNSRMGREAINVMISKVEDDDLALDLNRQACKFMQFEEKIQKEYMKAEEPLPEENLVGKTMLWGRYSDEYPVECQYQPSGRYDDSGKYKRYCRSHEGSEE